MLKHWYCTYVDQNNVAKGIFPQSGAFKGKKYEKLGI